MPEVDYYNNYGGEGWDGGSPGDVGGFTVRNDDDGNPIGSSGYGTTYPGVNYEPVTTNTSGGYGDAFKVLDTIGNSISGVAKSVLGYQQAVAQFKTQQSGITLARDQALAGNDIARLNNASAIELAKIKTAGTVDVAKYNAATQSMLAQRALQSSAMPSLGALFYPATVNPQTGAASINPLFVVLAAGGFFLAYKSMKR